MVWQAGHFPLSYRLKFYILCAFVITFFLMSMFVTIISLSGPPIAKHPVPQGDWMKSRMIPPRLKDYFLDNPFTTDFSRGQSRIIDTLLQQKENGFFVDIGAGDGETNSITLYFERERTWSGVLVEASEAKHRMSIEKSRQCHLWNFRIVFGDEAPHGREDSIKTQELFDMINRTSIDLLSVNLHGQELDLLKAIDFVKYHIRVVTIELQHDVSGERYKEIKATLEKHGYDVAHHVFNSVLKKKDVIFTKL